MSITLIPCPQHDESLTGVWAMPRTPHVANDGFAPYCYAAFLERCGLTEDDVVPASDDESADIVLRRDAAHLGEEEYRLAIRSDGVTITAADEHGVIHALTSLYLLVVGDEPGCVECRVIEDMPRYRHRGLSFDCVRHFFDVDEVLRVIEAMSLNKLNVLHWHLTDDQGWRIESKRYPELAAQPGNRFYTQGEIRHVVAYARDRGVEVIPEIEMPGHMRGLLVSHPELSCTGEHVDYATQYGIHDVILCPGKEDTFTVMNGILDEVCELFDSPYIHIGGDEAPKTKWASCARCQARMTAEGLVGLEQLQGYFTNRIASHLVQDGRVPICWNESLDATNLDPGVVIQFWTPSHQERIRPYMDHGGQLVFSDMFDLYLDYPASMTPMRRIYETRPIIEDVDYTDYPGMLGVEAAIWCEHVDSVQDLERRVFPRLIALAENAWSGPRQGDESYRDFLRRLADMLPLLERIGIAHLDIDRCDPQGAERQRETFSYMTQLSSNLAEGTAEASQPNEAFQHAFMTKFFRPEDLPLLGGMAGKA